MIDRVFLGAVVLSGAAVMLSLAGFVPELTAFAAFAASTFGATALQWVKLRSAAHIDRAIDDKFAAKEAEVNARLAEAEKTINDLTGRVNALQGQKAFTR